MSPFNKIRIYYHNFGFVYHEGIVYTRVPVDIYRKLLDDYRNGGLVRVQWGINSEMRHIVSLEMTDHLDIDCKIQSRYIDIKVSFGDLFVDDFDWSENGF